MSWTEAHVEERNVKTLPAVAGAAIGKYRILQKGSSAYEVIQATAGTQYPIGVSGNASELFNKATYEAADEMAVKYDGIVYVEMSGSGNRHDRIMATTGGKGLKHATSDGVYIFGHAMSAWADGDICPVMIDRYFIPNFENS